MLLAAHSQSARAQPSGYSITLRAPDDAGCPTQHMLSQDVAARVGTRPKPAAGKQAIAIDVQIDHTHSGFRALVEVRDPSVSEVGRRELRAEGACDALTEMLTLVIAASVGSTEPEQEAEPPAPRPPPPPPPLAADEAESEAEPASEINIVHDTEPPRPWAFDAALSLRLQSGIAPSLLFGPSLAFWASWGALRLGVSGTWLLPRSDSLMSGVLLRETAGYAELDLCGIVARSTRAGLSFCIAPQAGAVHAQPQALARAEARWDALAQLSASVHAELLVASRVGVTLTLGAALPVVYPRYSHVDQAGEQRIDHRLELGVWGGLGLWMRLQP